jgi:hypothetical protein
MKKYFSTYSTIFVYSLIVILGFFLWLILLLAAWVFLKEYMGIITDFWGMTEALSTAVAAATVLGAGFVAYRELSEISTSRYIDVANRLFEEMNSAANIDARRWVFQNLDPDPSIGIPGLSSEGKNAIKTVLNSLDHASFLTQAGWIPEEMIMPWMHPMIAKSWEKLEPYVIYERKRRNEPDYYRYANQLADRCKIWRSKHYPEGLDINWISDAL